MKRITVYFCMIACFFFLATTLSGFTFAQSKQAQTAAPQRSVMSLIGIETKAAMGLEFENLLKTDIIPAMKKAGATQLSVWKTERFGNPNKYLLISPLQGMAEFDQPSPLMKVLGQEGVAALMAKMQKIVQSTRRCSMEAQPALSFAPKQGYALKMGVLATNSRYKATSFAGCPCLSMKLER
jgi:hypothetical protein